MMRCGLVALTLGLLAGCGSIDREAEREFRAALGKSTMSVFPSVVWSGGVLSHDEEGAREIAAFLERSGLARAAIPDARLTLNTRGGRNQAGMWRRSQAAFVQYLKDHPISTDYVFLAEYLVGRNGVAGGVHGYVVKADGSKAYGFLLNSHHRLLWKIKPRTNADCARLVVELLETELAGYRQRSRGHKHSLQRTNQPASPSTTPPKPNILRS